MDAKKAQRLIKKAIKEGRIEFAPTTEIDAYEHLFEDFFEKFLKMGSKYFFSDQSTLSDCCPCGLPEGIESDNHKATSAAWAEWVIPAIEARYGVHVDTVQVTLVELFEQIDQSRAT